MRLGAQPPGPGLELCSDRDSVVSHRRTPIVPSGDGPTKAKQPVADTVVQPQHASQLRLVGIEGSTEGDEHQAVFVALDPGERTPHDEGFWIDDIAPESFPKLLTASLDEMALDAVVATDDWRVLLNDVMTPELSYHHLGKEADLT